MGNKKNPNYRFRCLCCGQAAQRKDMYVVLSEDIHKLNKIRGFRFECMKKDKTLNLFKNMFLHGKVFVVAPKTKPEKGPVS